MGDRYTFDVIICWADGTTERLTTAVPGPSESFQHEGHWFDYIGTQEGDRFYKERVNG